MAEPEIKKTILKKNLSKEGVVSSVNMKNGMVVRIDRLKKHIVYGKYIKIATKVKVHYDDRFSPKVGDKVKITMSRPYSKDIHWTLLEILK